MNTRESLTNSIIFLRLSSIAKMGYKSLITSCEFFNCNLEQLHLIDDKALYSAGWHQGQIETLKGRTFQIESQIRKVRTWLMSDSRHHLIYYGHPDYPAAFNEMDSPPLVFFAAGNIDYIHFNKLAIVGTRAPTQYAFDVLNHLIPAFSFQQKFATISGLALGVDAMCHRISMSSNIPTIGVLGCGIDQIYPKRHLQLYEQVKENGLLISEFMLGTTPKAFNFPKRNRLISALSNGLLITEGKIKSGTMVTVKCAIEQNKEVLAVPCSVFNKNGELSHYLISDGATPVKEAKDIIACLPEFGNIEEINKNNEKNAKQDFTSDPLLDSVDGSATSVDLIAKRTGTPIVDVLTKLLEYELRGLVASTAEGYVKLRG